MEPVPLHPQGYCIRTGSYPVIPAKAGTFVCNVPGSCFRRNDGKRGSAVMCDCPAFTPGPSFLEERTGVREG